MKAKLSAAYHAAVKYLLSTQARPAEVALLRVILAALGVKLGVGFYYTAK